MECFRVKQRKKEGGEGGREGGRKTIGEKAVIKVHRTLWLIEMGTTGIEKRGLVIVASRGGWAKNQR